MSRSRVQVPQVAPSLFIFFSFLLSNFVSDFIMNEKELMKIAFKLAKQGKEKTFPNPNVGAIVYKNGKIIGKGYHRYFGDLHAEIHALKQAGNEAKDSTLFVTLEPCSHYGKTPPCVDAIIKAGIKEVFVGIKDPNPMVNGKGIEVLKKHGIKIYTGIMKKDLERFYEDYSKRFTEKKSYVVLKYAMTLDGKIATTTGNSKWISSIKSRQWVHNFRTKFDGILVGVNTIINDDPLLTSHNHGRNPVRIVIDPGLDIPLVSKILNDDIPVVIIHSNLRKKRKIVEIQNRRKYLIHLNSQKGMISFKKIIEALRKISIFSILIEGGGFTAWSALKDGVVDEIITFVSPKIIGGKDAITPVEGEGIKKVKNAIKTKILEYKRIDEDIFIRSKVIY